MDDKNLEIKFERSPQADATLAGDRAAIYHRETKKAITLNPVGTILWQELEHPKSEQELVEVLAQKFSEVPRETLCQDVTKFVEQLSSHSLIVSSSVAG